MKTIGTISRPIEILLRIFGLWPGSLYIPFCRVFWMISFIFIITFQYRYIINHLHSVDLPELVDNICLAVGYLLFAIKLVIFWFNQRMFNKMLTMIAMDWRKNTNTDFTMPVMTRNANLSHNFFNFIFSCYAIAVMLNGIVIYTVDIVDNETSTESTRPLIIKMDLPFDIDRQLIYDFIMLSQFLHLLLCVCLNATLTGLLIALVLHVGGQIDILCRWLGEIFEEKEKCSLQATTIKKVIEKHQKIITFSENIEILYSYLLMTHILSDITRICSMGFVIFTSIGTNNMSILITRYIASYLMIHMQALMFCSAGEYLSTKSKIIGEAVYNSRWYESDFKNNRFMLLLIMRSQNQLAITIGKISNLSLRRFTDIVKASISYISVLLALY